MNSIILYLIQLIILMTSGYFISIFLNRHVEYDETYLKKHLLKKNSKLNILFLGKKCNYIHPHTDIMSYIYLLFIVLTMVEILLTIIFISIGIEITDSNRIVFFAIYFYGPIIVISSALIAKEVEFKKCKKETKKMTADEKNIIRENCSKEWPGFFDIF